MHAGRQLRLRASAGSACPFARFTHGGTVHYFRRGAAKQNSRASGAIPIPGSLVGAARVNSSMGERIHGASAGKRILEDALEGSIRVAAADGDRSNESTDSGRWKVDNVDRY